METLKSNSGRPLTDEVIEGLANRAEAGFDPAKLRPRPVGRPSLGDEVRSPRIQVRLPRPLYRTLAKRAHDEGTTVSAIVRNVLEKDAAAGASADCTGSLE